MPSLPKVLIVGGPDVDARLELMHHLQDAFDLGALGSEPALRDRFLTEGFSYSAYHLSRQANPLSDLLTIGQLAFMFHRSRPQIVHAFDTKPGIWGCLAARLAGVPVVVGTVTGLGSLYANDDLATRSIRWVYQTLQKLACHVSELTIFQNHSDARQFIAARVVPAQKALVISGSGVATDVFAPAQVSDAEQARLRNELGIRRDEIVVTMISRVIRSKGVLEFMAAALGVRRDYPQVRFLLIGPEDAQSADPLSAAELAQLKQAVTWPGPRRDIPAVLAVSDIFVLPSAYREGIPRVLLEAASMGLPIVTTNSPGCDEVVEHGLNGFLVPVRDSAALSQAIVRLIEQRELCQRFGRASRQRAVEQFDLSMIAKQTHAVYQQLLARKCPQPARDRRLSNTGKRLFDLVFAACSLLVTWPLILTGALAVKLTSPGPALYRAKRAGLGGRPFDMLKLRTMRVGTDTADRRVTAERDDRITPVGHILRKFKIDELPQLWNVLRGEMSIVGPRPEDWDIVQQYYTPEQRRMLEVRPGIAALADVSWYPDLTYHDPPPAGIPIQEWYLKRHLPVQAAEGLRYVEQQSMLLDLKILARMVFCVLFYSWLPPKKQPLSLERQRN